VHAAVDSGAVGKASSPSEANERGDHTAWLRPSRGAKKDAQRFDLIVFVRPWHKRAATRQRM
jgi:hypothetical protein